MARSMNIWSATSIGVGAMIGAGIFALIGIAVDLAGNLAYLSFIIAGAIALLTCYSVARLSLAYPSKAGRVKYLNEAFGKGVFAGTLNIIMWFGYVIVNSLYARAFAEYGAALLQIPQDSMYFYLLSSGVIVLFLVVNFVGASLVGKSELIIVAIKVGILLFFGISGLFYINAENLSVQDPDLGSVLVASGVVFMSYEGFGLVANTAEDVKNPQKNLPKALFFSVGMVLVIYVLVSISVIGNLPLDQILKSKEYALAEAAKPLFGETGFQIMGIAALVSVSSAINATIYGPVYMLQETAKARQAPKIFRNPLFQHESGYALLFTGGIVLLTANLLNLEAIAETGSMVFLIIYLMVNVANYILRKKTESKAWIILLGILGTLFALGNLVYFQIKEESMSVYALLILIGVVTLYQLLHHKKFSFQT